MKAKAVKKYSAGIVLAISVLAAAPHSTHAAVNKIDDDAHYDGRVQGYDPDVELPAASAGLNWFLLLAMCAVCVGVIFKDAKRSHLD